MFICKVQADLDNTRAELEGYRHVNNELRATIDRLRAQLVEAPAADARELSEANERARIQAERYADLKRDWEQLGQDHKRSQSRLKRAHELLKYCADNPGTIIGQAETAFEGCLSNRTCGSNPCDACALSAECAADVDDIIMDQCILLLGDNNGNWVKFDLD